MTELTAFAVCEVAITEASKEVGASIDVLKIGADTDVVRVDMTNPDGLDVWADSAGMIWAVSELSALVMTVTWGVTEVVVIGTAASEMPTI